MTVSSSRLVAEALRDAINSGGYAPGDRLPSERELAASEGVARNTAAAAIRQLVDEGLVRVEHGRGAFVADPPALPAGWDVSELTVDELRALFAAARAELARRRSTDE